MNSKKGKSGQKGKRRAKTASLKGSPKQWPADTRLGAPRTAKRQEQPAGAYTVVAPDPGVTNLDKIKHVVVLMMENRSFDQMLGYLRLNGTRDDMNGLAPGSGNAYNGKSYPVFHQTSATLRSRQDPCHDGRCVAE